MKIKKMGILGLSEGNGHPYSWSAIFNGYDSNFMKDCPFPVIPSYLAQQDFPKDSLGHLGSVTHIWCQDNSVAKHVANSSKIPFVVDEMEQMLGEVDAVLLARDDAEHHFKMSLPFLKAGLPIFIDKPLALSVADANNIWDNQQYPNQVFTCSSLRFSKELMLSKEELESLGTIKHVEGTVMKKWEIYAIHILESALSQLPNRGKLVQVGSTKLNDINQVNIIWEHLTGSFKTTGNFHSPLEIRFCGENGYITKTFKDSFNAFKNSLEYFMKVIDTPECNIPQAETLELVKIIELGIK